LTDLAPNSDRHALPRWRLELLLPKDSHEFRRKGRTICRDHFIDALGTVTPHDNGDGRM